MLATQLRPTDHQNVTRHRVDPAVNGHLGQHISQCHDGCQAHGMPVHSQHIKLGSGQVGRHSSWLAVDSEVAVHHCMTGMQTLCSM